MGLFIATKFKQNNIFFDFFYTKNEYNNKKNVYLKNQNCGVEQLVSLLV